MLAKGVLPRWLMSEAYQWEYHYLKLEELANVYMGQLVSQFPMTEYPLSFYGLCSAVGQCGNQVGCRFWDLALREHSHVNKVSNTF